MKNPHRDGRHTRFRERIEFLAGQQCDAQPHHHWKSHRYCGRLERCNTHRRDPARPDRASQSDRNHAAGAYACIHAAGGKRGGWAQAATGTKRSNAATKHREARFGKQGRCEARRKQTGCGGETARRHVGYCGRGGQTRFGSRRRWNCAGQGVWRNRLRRAEGSSHWKRRRSGLARRRSAR